MAGTRKQRTGTEFEDIARMDYDNAWPEDLQALHDATRKAWAAWAYLDDVVTLYYRNGEETNPLKRGTINELAGQAWALLKTLRAAGMAQLAEWEAATREQHDNEQYEGEQARRAVLGIDDTPAPFRVSYHEGEGLPYGVEASGTYADIVQWRAVMSPYHPAEPLRFALQSAAEAWIHEYGKPVFSLSGDPAVHDMLAHPEEYADAPEAEKEPAPAPTGLQGTYQCVDCDGPDFLGVATDDRTKYPRCPNCSSRSGVTRIPDGITIEPEPELVRYYCHWCGWSARRPLPDGGRDAPLPPCPACDRPAVELQA